MLAGLEGHGPDILTLKPSMAAIYHFQHCFNCSLLGMLPTSRRSNKPA